MIAARLNGLNGRVPVAAVTPTDPTKQKATRKRKRGLPPTVPDDWESKPLESSSMIQACTGNIRTYIVGRIQTDEAVYLPPIYLNRFHLILCDEM